MNRTLDVITFFTEGNHVIDCSQKLYLQSNAKQEWAWYIIILYFEKKF